MLLAMAGCNNATSPRDAVERFERAMNECDFRTAFAYVADYDSFGFSSTDGSEDIIKTVASSLRIDIISDTGGVVSSTVNVQITSVDLRKIYCDAAEIVIPQYYHAAVSGQSISSDEIGARLVEQVVSLSLQGTAATVTTQCALQLEKDDDDKWVIRLDTASYSAITGYLDEANNLITTGSISDAINNGGTLPTTPFVVSPTDVSPSDAS